MGNHPVNQWADESMERWFSDSMTQVNQWTSESMNQWFNDWGNEWVGESRHDSAIADSVNQPMSQWINDSVNPRIHEIMNIMKGWMDEWMDGANYILLDWLYLFAEAPLFSGTCLGYFCSEPPSWLYCSFCSPSLLCYNAFSSLQPRITCRTAVLLCLRTSSCNPARSVASSWVAACSRVSFVTDGCQPQINHHLRSASSADFF